MSSRRVTIGLLQHASPLAATKEDIMHRVADLAREAASKGAQVIATQELFASHYFCQREDPALMDLAEAVPGGPTCQFMQELAKKLKVEITASLYERRAAGVYHNTSVYIAATGELIGRYRKMHIPDDPRFSEKFYFTPGDLGWQVVDGAHARSGMLVCWDQWYPEAARLTAMRGAELLIYPTAIGWWHGETEKDRRNQRDAWITMQKAHAIANGVFVAAINRIGTESELKFWGTSMVCDPAGQVIAEAPVDEPCALVVSCDLAQIEEQRRGWPFLRDRRIDAYGAITQRLVDT